MSTKAKSRTRKYNDANTRMRKVNHTALVAIQFTYDMTQSLKDEQSTQEKMLQDILRVSDSLKSEVAQTNQIMENLQEASNSVFSSVKEISERTQETVLSVQEQSKMTESISHSINETANHAKVMVQTAEDSKRMMTQGMDAIANIKDSAEHISKTNSNVAETMSELSEKSKEVQQITEVIFSISSQTNLLALNASVESARAGEAGRGFAVVADQIRALSEETRQSTEKIAGIVEELVHHAQDATNIVTNSIDAMNKQNRMFKDCGRHQYSSFFH